MDEAHQFILEGLLNHDYMSGLSGEEREVLDDIQMNMALSSSSSISSKSILVSTSSKNITTTNNMLNNNNLNATPSSSLSSMSGSTITSSLFAIMRYVGVYVLRARQKIN